MIPQKRVSKTIVVQTPNAGINDLDPYANMDPKFCIDLVDVFPDNSSLITRNGYKEWATGLVGPVQTILTMNLATSSRLLASTPSGIYDITTSTSTPSSPWELSTGYISYVQFSDASTPYLVGCDTSNPPFLYDGTDFTQFTKITEPTPPAYALPGQVWSSSAEFAALNLSDLSYVSIGQGRLWFIQKNTMNAWYLDFMSVSGELHVFPLGNNFRRGGALRDIGVWSFDAGNGLDDKLVFRTTTGELAIYSGSDPADAETFWLESIFYTGTPIGTIQSYTDFGGDLVYLSEAGLIPLSQVVQGAANSSLYEQTLSKNISKTLSRLIRAEDFRSNWSVVNLPILQALFVIIPQTAREPARQYVMNSLTGAWTRYSLPANCATVFNNKLFFGNNSGKVFFLDGALDGVDLDGENGEPVVGKMFTAFSYFNDPATLKHFKLIRPIFQSDSRVGFVTQLNVDFDLRPQTDVPEIPSDEGDGYKWDEALWDEALWGYHNVVHRPWVGVVGMGYSAAIRMKISSESIVQFPGLEVVYEEGKSL